jgi:hypothetical protein
MVRARIAHLIRKYTRGTATDEIGIKTVVVSGDNHRAIAVNVNTTRS